MKIQLLSDLHLEADPSFKPTPAPGTDLLVLAGDIGSYQNGSQLSDHDFGLARFSPRHGWPTPVLFVPGNHEYDRQDFDLAHERLRETCARLGIRLLEREVVTAAELLGPTAPPVRFVGTTLWSDFDALNPAAQSAGGALTQVLQARDKAFRAANFYLRKTETLRSGQAMLAEQIREQALVCQAWLRDTLAQRFDGQTVVITHFAPSLQSADPRYGLAPGTAGFCNALDDLLPHAQLWLHGHLHCPSDYTRHGCRVVANPLGYARKGEQALFNPTLCLDLSSDLLRKFDAGHRLTQVAG
ncbi:MAG: metallophosphoesterase [Hylemonella sp.]|nr:metallophosphoesterase [Hylemonella sp.]MDP1937764.1 metallophosphoesterase [Hylemonella sp.]